jgi:hypothetical protein
VKTAEEHRNRNENGCCSLTDFLPLDCVIGARRGEKVHYHFAFIEEASDYLFSVKREIVDSDEITEILSTYDKYVDYRPLFRKAWKDLKDSGAI